MTEAYICAATRIRVRGPLQIIPFLRASFAASGVARKEPGNVRTRLLGSPLTLWFHTVTVWDSEEALLRFVKSPEHRAAIAGMEEWGKRGKFVRFSSETPKVGWRRAFRELRDPDGVYLRGVGHNKRAARTTPTEGQAELSAR